MTSPTPHNALSPRVMLASAMHAQPGVYALLLGSGISTGAGIPTGWGVVKSLVQRIAAAADPDDTDSQILAESDPEEWWRQHGHRDLGYSSLLAKIAPNPATRQGILRKFFVATDDDREAGQKVPSKAHRAIAELVKRGTVKVIVTTNFDRLTEQALQAVGIEPQVITRPGAVAGMTPLSHAEATVIKLHGDYEELDSRNTIDELDSYPREWVELLTRVFSEYGLLASGWSADWDTALVRSLESTPRRYPLYWDSRSAKGHAAQQLLTQHRGHAIPADSADELFGDLAASIDALDRLAEPPLTTAMAIARLKRSLPDPIRRIDLHDLVMGRLDRVATTIQDLPVAGTPTPEILDERLAALLNATTPLLHLLREGVHHDLDGAHAQLWIDVVQRLLDARLAVDASQLAGLQHYPALLALRTMSLVAVHRGRDDLLIELLTVPQWSHPTLLNRPKSAAHVLHLQEVLDTWTGALPRWGGVRWKFPESHLLRADLEGLFKDYLGPRHLDVVHDVEYRTGLAQFLDTDGLANHPNSGEFAGEQGWDFYSDDPKPFAEQRFREQIARRGPRAWALISPDSTWDDSCLDRYREVLNDYQKRARWSF
ncbi:SIR2-like domain-containing protein [Nocardia nova SH22a]|uniref:SIR2-like domain-containing protein n=1 Tax=Nocardia nova SH22a TaxID=1415166 RepID=W5TI59_9NOCA|nr:SIR2 family protein [Nocardia nova]AHH16891.1 SIR2-like domain-containing protein [Nocardia nova SH22a]